MRDKLKKYLNIIGRWIEYVLALLILIAVIFEVIQMWKPLADIFLHNSSDKYLTFLQDVLNIVIGIEFLRLLADPDLNVVLEVMMFAMTRHIIVSGATALENLLTVIGIGIIALIRVLLKNENALTKLMRYKHTYNRAINQKMDSAHNVQGSSAQNISSAGSSNEKSNTGKKESKIVQNAISDPDQPSEGAVPKA